MSLAIALGTLPFWGLLAVGLYFDLYLTYPWLGVIMKALFPIVALSNIVGVVAGAVSAARNKERRIPSVARVVLNALPIVAVGIVLYWWVFLFKM